MNEKSNLSIWLMFGLLVLTVLGLATDATSVGGIYGVLLIAAKLIFVVAIISIPSHVGTEGVKVLLRMIFSKEAFGRVDLLSYLAPRKMGSWFLAGFVAYAAVHGLNADFLSTAIPGIFDAVDPEKLGLVKDLFNGSAVLLGSNILHYALPDGVGKIPKDLTKA